MKTIAQLKRMSSQQIARLNEREFSIVTFNPFNVTTEERYEMINRLFSHYSHVAEELWPKYWLLKIAATFSLPLERLVANQIARGYAELIVPVQKAAYARYANYMKVEENAEVPGVIRDWMRRLRYTKLTVVDDPKLKIIEEPGRGAPWSEISKLTGYSTNVCAYVCRGMTYKFDLDSRFKATAPVAKPQVVNPQRERTEFDILWDSIPNE